MICVKKITGLQIIQMGVSNVIFVTNVCLFKNLLGLKVHSRNVPKHSSEKESSNCDEVFNYVMLMFKLIALYRNLDSAVV
jgi:hypothetical protein